jgi:hypothetical protein
MKFGTKIFDEPSLEFGDKHHHPDPRLGLFEAGPLQTPLGDVVRIAVVGSAKTVEDTKEFFEQTAHGFVGKGEKHIRTCIPTFPGLAIKIPSAANLKFLKAPPPPSRKRRSTRSGRSQITSKRLRWPSMSLSSNSKS